MRPSLNLNAIAFDDILRSLGDQVSLLQQHRIPLQQVDHAAILCSSVLLLCGTSFDIRAMGRAQIKLSLFGVPRDPYPPPPPK